MASLKSTLKKNVNNEQKKPLCSIVAVTKNLIPISNYVAGVPTLKDKH